MMQMTKEVIKKYIPLYLSGSVLDVGAGNKKYKVFIEKYCEKYVTLDIQGDVDYVADASAMPIDNEVFDCALSFQMFEHVKEPELIVSEIYRILKKGGICIATVPFMAPEHADPYDFQRFTTYGFKSLFEKSGFKVLNVEKYGGPATVFVESIKFAYFSPYTSGKIKLKIGQKILRILYWLANIIDRRRDATSIYGNVVVVAQK